MAATFVNLSRGLALRVVAKREARERARELFPDLEDRYRCQIEAYKVMPDEELFTSDEVAVHIPPQDMPGRPLSRVRCDVCGEYIQDMREVRREESILCRPCATEGYYSRR